MKTRSSGFHSIMAGAHHARRAGGLRYLPTVAGQQHSEVTLPDVTAALFVLIYLMPITFGIGTRRAHYLRRSRCGWIFIERYPDIVEAARLQGDEGSYPVR